MSDLVHLMPLLLLLPSMLMWRRDTLLHRAAIAEVRGAPLHQRHFPATDAWQRYNRRFTGVTLACVTTCMLVGLALILIRLYT